MVTIEISIYYDDMYILRQVTIEIFKVTTKINTYRHP